MEQKIKFPRSQKVYLPGKLYPNIRVAMRKVEQVPSTSFEGDEKIVTPNPEVYVYDTSGPFSDSSMSIDLKKGLPRLREEWIVSRGDVEQLPEITSEYGQMRRDDKSLDHLRFEHIALPYRARKGEAITQMAYAKRGIITPEMEYVAIRENMNCRELGIDSYITPEFVRQEIAGSKALPFVAYLHRLVLEPVENGVLGHPEQIAAERFDVPDRLARFPEFQKDIVRQILGFAPVFQHAEGKRLHMRGVTHV